MDPLEDCRLARSSMFTESPGRDLGLNGMNTFGGACWIVPRPGLVDRHPVKQKRARGGQGSRRQPLRVCLAFVGGSFEKTTSG